jgi:hypothetical protein
MMEKGMLVGRKLSKMARRKSRSPHAPANDNSAAAGEGEVWLHLKQKTGVVKVALIDSPRGRPRVGRLYAISREPRRLK